MVGKTFTFERALYQVSGCLVLRMSTKKTKSLKTGVGLANVQDTFFVNYLYQLGKIIIIL